jgi:hypothetical protein
VSLPGRLGHAMAGRPRACSFFFLLLFLFLIWAFRGVQGFRRRFHAASSFSLSESLSVLFCLVLVGLCSISSARAKSRAQALVIRSHNSVVVDIRRITCISPSLPTLLGSRSSIVFSHLNGAQVNLSETLLTEFFFTSSVSAN